MSVRCTYCGGSGHNRVSCQARKEAVARHKQEMADGVREYPSSLMEEDDRYKRRKTKPRKCSYCYNRHHLYEYDHNRRNCPRLAEDRAALALENKEWREEALSVMKERGIGVGAILDHPNYGHCLITEVHWQNISCLIQKWYEGDPFCFTITSLKSMAQGTGRQRTLGFPRLGKERGYLWRYANDGDFNMVVPASARFIEANVPSGWSSGATGLDLYFSPKNDGKC